MASLAARIPPELFDEILSCVEDEHDLVREYEDSVARRRTLRYLSNCSSVCIHWANFIRPRMFQILLLDSAKDLYDLLALLRVPCSPRIRDIGSCLRNVAVFYRLEDYFWCHNLQRLQRCGVHEEFGLRIHISGRAPSILIRDKHHTVRHPLFYTIPRIVPFHRQPPLYADLILDRISFPNGTGLLNLMRDLSYSRILPRFVSCKGVVWPDELSLPLASLDLKSQLNQLPYVEPINVTVRECSDNFLTTFAIHSHIGRRERGVFMLNRSDADRFLDVFSEWADLARQASFVHSDVTSQAFLARGSLGESNRLLKSEQGVTELMWKLQKPSYFLAPYNSSVEFGCHTRLKQNQDPGGAQTTHISSIVIRVYDSKIRRLDWNPVLLKALQFPMLDTMEVCIHGQSDLRRFVNHHRQVLDVAERRGMLRLCVSETSASQNEHWRQIDLRGQRYVYPIHVDVHEPEEDENLSEDPTESERGPIGESGSDVSIKWEEYLNKRYRLSGSMRLSLLSRLRPSPPTPSLHI